jgi:protoporphyrinogen oxidase
MSEDKRDWAIIGGGMMGLSLALRLVREGRTVTVYEGASEIGGLASSVELAGITWDRFYHVTLLSDSALRSLLNEVDLEDDMRWVATGTGLYDKGQLYPVSSAFDYLKLPVLSPTAKARIAATVLRASRINDWRALEQISAEEWLTKWSGQSAYDTFWKPLLRAKLGAQHDQASAAFIWAIIQRLYAARRAGMKQDLFGYVPGGYARILDRLQQVLLESGVEIRTSSNVRSVTDEGGKVRVLTDDGEQVFGGAVVTTSSPIAVRLVPQLTDDEIAAHESLVYQGVVCVTLLMDRPLGGYYVTNITDPEIPFTGVIEMTAVVDPAEFGGRTLVYLPKYVAPDDELFDVPDGEIEAAFVESLRRMYPDIADSNIEASIVSRARYVLPLNTIGYSTKLPPMKTSVPGVHIVNTAHIVNGTLNIDETIQLANRVAADLLEESVSEVAS